jgi:hypothetical protein
VIYESVDLNKNICNFVPKKSGMAARIVIFFMVIVIGSFDRHIAYYFPVDVAALMQSDAVPAHHDLPVNACDSHEDITVKTVFCDIPSPEEFKVFYYRDFEEVIVLVSPHTIWQPPEWQA